MKLKPTVFVAGLMLACAGFARPAAALAEIDSLYLEYAFTDNDQFNYITLDLFSSSGFPGSIDSISGYMDLPTWGISGAVIGPDGAPASNIVYGSLNRPPYEFYITSISFSADGYYIELLDPPMITTIDIYPNLYDLENNIDPSFSGPIAATPLPGALPLLTGGLSVLGFLALRRKRRTGEALSAA
jgi:hypothetical protein